MSVQILGQVCINVVDIERSLEFWEGVCGLELQHRTEIPGVLEAVLQSRNGGSRLQLAQHLDGDDGGGGGEREGDGAGTEGDGVRCGGEFERSLGLWKIYVNTSDCRELYERAVAAGCESFREPEDLERWPVTIAFVRDFDGYLIEFVEHHQGTRPGVPDPKKV